MEEQLFYRQGSLQDLQGVKETGIAAYGQYATALTPANWELLNGFLTNERSLEQLIAQSKVFVCTHGNKVAGVAYLVPRGHPTDIFPAHWCYIRMLGVRPEYSGRGIAKNLTGLCIEAAKEGGEKTIALHTSEFMSAARHIYESIGFKMIRELPERLGKRYWLYTMDL